MLAQLSKGKANVSDLAKPFLKEMSLPAITKHLKVLEKAGLIIAEGPELRSLPDRVVVTIEPIDRPIGADSEPGGPPVVVWPPQ